MFQEKTLNYIFCVSLAVVIILPLITVRFIFPLFTKIIVEDIKVETVRVARHMSSMSISKVTQWEKEALPNEFISDIEQITKDYNIEKIQVFSSSGEVIYSTDPGDIGEMNTHRYFHEIVAKGNTYTQVVQKEGKTFEGRVVSADVVETYVPVMSSGKVLGVFELYYDITRRNQELNMVILYASIIPLAIMFGFLVIIVGMLFGLDRNITGRKRTEEELKTYRDHLEESVKERTVALQQEIEERKRMEEVLAEERNLLRTLIDNLPDNIYVKDTESRFLLANHAVGHVMGVATPDELVGKTDFDFHSQTLAEQYYADEQTAIESGQPLINKEQPLIDQDTHTTKWILTTKIPFRDSHGKILGLVGIGRDITERKRAEEELQKAKDAAESANTLKSEFLANMSHDIRTPMNAILGFSEILKEHLRDSPQYHEYLNGIMHGGRTLLQLINDILDLSKIEAGRLDIRPEAMNLQTMITEIQQMFSLNVREKGIRFESHLSPDTPTTVLLDGARLRQILVNLVGNAIKFTEKGSVTLGVAVRSNRFSDLPTHAPSQEGKTRNAKALTTNLLFEVQDTGIGIPKEEQELIFDPFTQHTRSFGGTGLGLAITKRLVELMGGTISVESTVNAGSGFTVVFPDISVVTRKEEMAAGKDHDPLDVQFHGSTVLLVEDNASNRAVIRGYVAVHDLRLVEVENGQEAIQLLTFPSREGFGVGFRPDLILMDIQMPVMNGDEATKIIKGHQNLRGIPVVALTAYAIKEQREQFHTLFDAYLSKPMFKAELIATFAQFLPHTTLSAKEEGERAQHAATGTLPGEHGASAFPGIGPRGILEDLKAYSAHSDTFPKEFLETLHDDLLPKHREISEVMSIDEIIEFAEALIAAGDSFTIPPLKKYGDELLRRMKVFDFSNVKHLLTWFPSIVEIIRGKEL